MRNSIQFRAFGALTILIGCCAGRLLADDGAPVAQSHSIAQNSVPCGSDTSRFALGQQKYFGDLLSDPTDSLAIAARTRWGVTTMPADSVRVVSDSAECQTALAAYLSIRGTKAEVGLERVIVLTLGPARRVVVPEVPNLGTSTGIVPALVFASTYTEHIDTWW